MNRLHTLLAATDLSAPSRHAAQRAAMLARQTGARLELVHVLEKSLLDEGQQLLGETGEVLSRAVRLQAAEALARLAAEIAGGPGTTVGQHLMEATVLEAIAQLAAKVKAGLLVVGVRGEGFMRHWLLGTTAERLLRKTQLPVLVVKQPPRGAYRSVLVPVDFSPWSRGAIGLAQALAPNADLVLLHAYQMPFEGKLRFAGIEEEAIRGYRVAAREKALADLHQAAADAGITDGAWRPVVVHGDPANRILEQEEEQGADLIVLGKHGAGMVEEMLLGSVTTHVLAQARTDVLVASR